MGNLWTFGLVVSHLSHPVRLILSLSCQLYLYPAFTALKDLNHTHILKEGLPTGGLWSQQSIWST